MAEKPVSEAKTLIDSLLSQGLKKSQIAKRLGIDSSTITQVERGKKPGRNLIEPLRAIAEKREAVPARQVRQTKSGEPARVRQSKKPTAPKTLKRDSAGRIKIAEETRQAAAAVRRLEQIAADGGRVTLIVRMDDGTVRRVFDRGGEYAARLATDYRQSGERFFGWLTEIVAEQLGRQYSGQSFDEVSVVGVAYLAIYGDAAVLK